MRTDRDLARACSPCPSTVELLASRPMHPLARELLDLPCFDLPIATLRCVCLPDAPLRFDDRHRALIGAALTLRGAIGEGLHRVGCLRAARALPPCDLGDDTDIQCDDLDTCPHAILMRARGAPDVPMPWRPRFEPLVGRTIERPFELIIDLWGHASLALRPVLANAVRLAGQLGLEAQTIRGRSRVHYEVKSVLGLDDPPCLLRDLAARRADQWRDVKACVAVFRTPASIKQRPAPDQKSRLLLQADEIPFLTPLVTATRRAIDTEAVLRQPRAPATQTELPRARLAQLATTLATEAPVRCVDSLTVPIQATHRSTRTHRPVALAGLLGSASFEGPIGASAPMLTLAEHLGLGGHTAFGLGRVTFLRG